MELEIYLENILLRLSMPRFIDSFKRTRIERFGKLFNHVWKFENSRRFTQWQKKRVLFQKRVEETVARTRTRRPITKLKGQTFWWIIHPQTEHYLAFQNGQFLAHVAIIRGNFNFWNRSSSASIAIVIVQRSIHSVAQINGWKSYISLMICFS